jgi:hypothetical protein
MKEEQPVLRVTVHPRLADSAAFTAAAVAVDVREEVALEAVVIITAPAAADVQPHLVVAPPSAAHSASAVANTPVPADSSWTIS